MSADNPTYVKWHLLLDDDAATQTTVVAPPPLHFPPDDCDQCNLVYDMLFEAYKKAHPDLWRADIYPDDYWPDGYNG